MTQTFRAYEKDSKYGLAIVTGGSSGIGKLFIEQIIKLSLAHRLFNLSRSKTTTFYNDNRVTHLECDLSDPNARKSALQTLEHEADQATYDGPILLVNNAGRGAYGSILTSTYEHEAELIELNISAIVHLTAFLLPKMKQRGGDILNIASTAAFQATPHMATYGATKSFVLNWTAALNNELRNTNINAKAICPGPTETDFFANARSATQMNAKGYKQSPLSVVNEALRSLRSRKPFHVCGWRNRLLVFGSRHLPMSLQTRISGFLIRRFR